MAKRILKEDGFLFDLAVAIDREDAKKMVKNPKRIKDVIIVYEVLEKIAAGDGVKVSCEMHKPLVNTGSVTVEGMEIEIIDPEAFADCGSLANTFDVYSLIDGRVRMSFGFNDLAVKGVHHE